MVVDRMRGSIRLSALPTGGSKWNRALPGGSLLLRAAQAFLIDSRADGCYTDLGNFSAKRMGDARADTPEEQPAAFSV